jgi:hypothetical protein
MPGCEVLRRVSLLGGSESIRKEAKSSVPHLRLALRLRG